jgi:hypothetical protein
VTNLRVVLGNSMQNQIGQMTPHLTARDMRIKSRLDTILIVKDIFFILYCFGPATIQSVDSSNGSTHWPYIDKFIDEVNLL